MENAMAERQARESTEAPIKPLKPCPRPVKKSLGTVSGQAQDDVNTEVAAIQDVPESGTKMKGAKVNPKLRDAIEQAHNQVANDVATLATRGEKKTVSIKDGKSTIEGRIKNWNNVVVSATVPQARPLSFPHRRTPLPSHVFPIEPPTPSDEANYEERFRMLPSPKAMDDTVVIVENEDSNMEFFRIPQEGMYGSPKKNSSTSGGSALKRKRDNQKEDQSYSDVDKYEEEAEEGGPNKGRRVTGKTTVTAIDIDEDPLPMKKVKPEKVVHHRSQASISSVAPSVASVAVSTGNNLEAKSSHGSSRFTNNDLPAMFLKDRKWLKNVLPTLLLWLGDQPNIWSVPEGDLMHALREIIKVIFLKFTGLQDIRPNMPIFSLANNRLSTWHHSVGSTAIAMLDCFFADDPSAIIKETCNVLLTNRAFAYEGMKSKDVNVPALQLSVETNRARGAIALCVAVLEHAFKLVKAGVTSNVTDKGKGSLSQKSSSKPSGTENAFSEQHWGGTTCGYFESVANRDDLTLLSIVKSASALLQEDKDGDSSLDDAPEHQGSTTEEIDTHRLMCK
ncbi:hypothetical protein SCLCIDRAFT_24189 [Scleroderma citrinum Foug A]|uniref:Uncharacterized protein n=1 Tax=Scleroderma citrinum Foug A TaxID=1036808 RepID=A0A0C3E675_9AGAM|nr:hypothetical protein SCLCIDRAFT_24189 [Scleroderma citrinum Foug A]